MRFAFLRKCSRPLLLIVVVLALGWLALPRLLGFAAERWLALPGLSISHADIASIGGGQARARTLRGVYQTAGGHRLQFALHDLVLDYSPVRRHIDRLELARAEIIVLPSKAPPAPWPQLRWPQLPVSEARIRELHVAIHLPDRPPLATAGSLLVQQGENHQLRAEFRRAADLLRLTAEPGETLAIRLDWLPATTPPAQATLRIGQQPSQQPAMLQAQAPLTSLLSLSKALDIALPVADARGEITVQGEATLGELAGQVLAAHGEVEFAQLAASATLASPLAAALSGKAHFGWQQPQAGAPAQASIELQPGLRWQLQQAGPLALQAAGQLQQAFAIRMGKAGVNSTTTLPFTARSPQWGRWEGALQQVQIKTGEGPLDVREALSQWQIKGQLPEWRQGALQARDVQVAGDIDLRWQHDSGLTADTRLQVGVDALQVTGKTPMQIRQSRWTVTAGASQRAGSDGLKALEVRGEARSPALKIERGSAPALSLGPSNLRIVRFQPGQQQGEFVLSADKLKLGGWPAPDLRSRILLSGQQVKATGALALQQRPVLAFSASHALDKGCGAGLLTVKEDLAALGQALQPRPPALRPLDLQAGQTEGHIDVDWCTRGQLVLGARGNLRARGVNLGWERARLEDLNLSLQLEGIQPLQGRIQLDARGGQLATGTALSDFKFDAALTPKSLQMHALDLKLLGGSISAMPQSAPWPLAGHTLPLQIDSIDLAQLLALFKQPGLSGSGRLSGTLPLSYRDGGLEVRDGQLHSLANGTLKYAPTLAIPDNPGLQALRNLHFEKLGIQVWYAPGGAYRTEVKLDGNNPDFYNGYPVRFGLKLQGELPGLFRAALFSGDFNRHILEQLQSGKLE